MGKCCSTTVPPENAYSPINQPNTQKPMISQDNSTTESDHVIISTEENKVHSESRSISNKSSQTASDHQSDAEKDTVIKEQLDNKQQINIPNKQKNNCVLLNDNIKKQQPLNTNNNNNTNTLETNITLLSPNNERKTANINVQKAKQKRKNSKREKKEKEAKMQDENITNTLLKLLEMDAKINEDESKKEMIEMNGQPFENKNKKSVEMKDNKSTHSVIESMDIINTYTGNNSIHKLRRKYMKQYGKNGPSKIVKTKSTHSVVKSKKIIAEYKNKKMRKLKKIYKNEKNEITDENCNEMDLKLKKLKEKIKRRKSTHSVRRSSAIIAEYKGNNDIAILKKRYMKSSRDSKSNASEQKINIPNKPINILDFMNDEINVLHNEMCEYITSHMRYIGMVEFRKGNEMCIELEFTSNNNGYIKGNRLLISDGKLIEGNGRIYKDVLWNENINKYEGCIKFEWCDVYNNIVTKLSFNTNRFDYDIEHLYFEGKCYQYIMDNSVENIDINMEIDMCNVRGINKGQFNMVCVSMRKRHVMKRNGLLKYHETDIWDMNEHELKMVPKYIKCMNITPVKMYRIFTDDSKF